MDDQRPLVKLPDREVVFVRCREKMMQPISKDPATNNKVSHHSDGFKRSTRELSNTCDNRFLRMVREPIVNGVVKKRSVKQEQELIINHFFIGEEGEHLIRTKAVVNRIHCRDYFQEKDLTN